ncbi:MAG TPA: glycolate oxidase subunit GlcF [Stellaceae bacterium]|nr:glycolate oxidase subunit GlcF [Stellaceae bacterium]
MQTNFTLAQLADADVAEANRILRACVHCGFCTATCPTYVLLGDELDSPRGRIYLIKNMLERDRPASARVAKHIDRCLSCLSCMTTCPSGVNYMHLVDQARHHIERTFRRPWADRWLRALLAWLLPRPRYFRLALLAGQVARPFARLIPGRLGAIAALIPARVPSPSAVDRPQAFPAEGPRRRRVALMTGCVQTVLAPQIHESTVRLLTRLGCEVVVAVGAGCCGGITHHMGRDSLAYARANIDAWTREIEQGGLDAIVINTSGCGVTVKDWGYMLRQDEAYTAKAARISGLAQDLCEFVAALGLLKPTNSTGQRVAYHAACSLQHGQRLHAQPRTLLTQAGFIVLEVPEGHLCCGSAGTYNMLQPALAGALRERKTRAIESTRPDIVAAGNIGCIIQIAAGTSLPVVHTVELLDWATGGPMPAALTANA